MNRFVRRLAVLACVVAFATIAFAADGDPQPVPRLAARVTDLTDTLSAAQKQALESELAALEREKGAQLGVLIVPTTQPEDIAQYGIRVAEAWKLGRKGVDDGAILIVAKNDHRVRVEVGTGLEGAIPDAAGARIVREYVAPKFRANDYYGGIEDAVGALTKLIRGEPLPPPLTDDGARGRRMPHDLFNAAIFAFFVGMWARVLLARVRAAPRAGLVGAATGGAAWLLSGVVPFGLVLGVFGLVLGLFGGGGGGFANRGGWGGWGGGGFGGGGFGGGGFGGGGGGGGFSGGGGGFSGGGASGSW